MKQLLVFRGFDMLHLVALLLILLLGLLWVSQRRRALLRHGSLELRLGCVQETLSLLTDAGSPEARLLPCLRAISQIVQAEYFACYLRDGASPGLRLQALHQQGVSGQSIEIGYGRLTSYDRDHYLPPLTKRGEDVPHSVTLRPEGQHPELLIPLGEAAGLIVVGPTRRCTRAQLAELGSWQKLLGPLIQACAAGLGAQDQPTQPLPGQPQGRQSELEPLERLLLLLERLTMADGSALIGEQHGAARLLADTTDLQLHLARSLSEDSGMLSDLLVLLGDEDALQIAPGTALHSQLPPAIVMLGDCLLLLRVPAPNRRAIVLIWGERFRAQEEHQNLLQRILQSRIASLISAQGELPDRPPSAPLPELRELVLTTERLLPQSGRHSELVARYALAIAKELQLPDASCRNVALAAVLHDVGMAVLPSEVLGKPGQYTRAEHILLEFHPDFGADLLLSTIGDAQVARAVRQHHEQWDGHGYPGRIAGNDILLEARILAAADLFVAKLSGRSYRRPLTFEQAITSIQSAAGRQLDADVVQALLNWYAKKASALTDPFQPLAPCWVMLCCPDGIRQSCPAYTHREVNCWRIADADCSVRGVDCASCLVYTEYIYRSRHER